MPNRQPTRFALFSEGRFMHIATFNQTKNLQYENNIKQLAMQAHNAHYIPTAIWLPPFIVV
jgi:hypothetical protein